jgi:hypothetical protein
MVGMLSLECRKVKVTKSRRSSSLIGGSGEISIVDRGHLAVTTSGSLTLRELNLLGLL